MVPTRVYIEVPPGVVADARAAIEKIEQAGFTVYSDWHRLNPPQRHPTLEIQRVLETDILLVWPAGLAPFSWVKVGAAYVAGVRIIALGSLAGLPSEFKSFFVLSLPGGFSALLRHNLLKLGSPNYKAPRQTRRRKLK